MVRRISKYTQINTFARIFQVAKWTLKQASEEEKGSTHNCLAALVFLAFTLEAYVNHMAVSRIPDWPSIERNLGQQRRLRLLLSKVGLDPSFEERPFRSVAELVEIRDQLAHGRTVEIREETQDEGDINDGFTPAQANWEKAANPIAVKAYLEDVRTIVGMIHEAAGIPGRRCERSLAKLATAGGGIQAPHAEPPTA
jgi:hypothetical protein